MKSWFLNWKRRDEARNKLEDDAQRWAIGVTGHSAPYKKTKDYRQDNIRAYNDFMLSQMAGLIDENGNPIDSAKSYFNKLQGAFNALQPIVNDYIEQKQAAVFKLAPGLQPGLKQAAQNALDLVRGEIPLEDRVQQEIASTISSLQSGFGGGFNVPGSAARALRARDLGLQQLNLRNQGLEQLSSVTGIANTLTPIDSAYGLLGGYLGLYMNPPSSGGGGGGYRSSGGGRNAAYYDYKMARRIYNDSRRGLIDPRDTLRLAWEGRGGQNSTTTQMNTQSEPQPYLPTPSADDSRRFFNNYAVRPNRVSNFSNYLTGGITSRSLSNSLSF